MKVMVSQFHYSDTLVGGEDIIARSSWQHDVPAGAREATDLVRAIGPADV
jgi:hypothetical protein